MMFDPEEIRKITWFFYGYIVSCFLIYFGVVMVSKYLTKRSIDWLIRKGGLYVDSQNRNNSK